MERVEGPHVGNGHINSNTEKVNTSNGQANGHTNTSNGHAKNSNGHANGSNGHLTTSGNGHLSTTGNGQPVSGTSLTPSPSMSPSRSRRWKTQIKIHAQFSMMLIMVTMLIAHNTQRYRHGSHADPWHYDHCA